MILKIAKSTVAIEDGDIKVVADDYKLRSVIDIYNLN